PEFQSTRSSIWKSEAMTPIRLRSGQASRTPKVRQSPDETEEASPWILHEVLSENGAFSQRFWVPRWNGRRGDSSTPKAFASQARWVTRIRPLPEPGSATPATAIHRITAFLSAVALGAVVALGAASV